MKKALILTTVLVTLVTLPSYAQNTANIVPQIIEPVIEVPEVTPMEQDIAVLQKEWARIKYQVSDKNNQLDAIHKLEAEASSVTAKYSNKAEPKIWEAIILATDAGIVKGLSALGKVKKSKALLEASLQQNPNALDGSAHTSLGSIYYQVPGWPIAFGDDKKAEKHLKMAIKTNPNGIDPNFFYGDFLLQDGRYEESKIYLSKALQAPARPSRPLADAGRKQEIKAALAQIAQKLDAKGKSGYN